MTDAVPLAAIALLVLIVNAIISERKLSRLNRRTDELAATARIATAEAKAARELLEVVANKLPEVVKVPETSGPKRAG